MVDECHRSIYNIWRQVLEYFDASLIGLTATPTKQTIGFFGGNMVQDYAHEQAVVDGVNVGFDVYRIETKITKDGAKLTREPGVFVPHRDRRTKGKKYKELDNDLTYTANQLDRDVVSENQIRLVNVQRGFLDLSEMKSISASENDIADLRLHPGDVLFTEGGDRDKLGRGWVWTGELSECIHQNHIFRGRLVSNEMQPRFVSHHGNTFGKEWFIKAGKQTTNLASINLGILRRFPVPIPPAPEQTEIIAQVDETLSQIDAAEMQIEQSLLRAARLRQSILK